MKEELEYQKKKLKYEKARLEEKRERARFLKLEQQEYTKLSDEMIRLETDLNYTKQINAEISLDRFQEKAHIIGKRLLPYFVSLALALGIPTALGHNPFEIKKVYRHTREFITLDSYSSESKYGDFPLKDNLITFYGNYHLDSNNLYQRQVVTFKIDERSKSKIREFLKNNNVETLATDIKNYLGTHDNNFIKNDTIDFILISYLRNMLGEEIETIIESAANLSQEELTKGPYLMATYYMVDTNQYKELKDNNNLDVKISLAIFLILSLTNLIIKTILIHNGKNDPIDLLFLDINEKYPYVAIHEIEQELNEIKTKLKSYNLN